jgi:alkylation response protein AidB-like acyl-CoA dehydrogenase
MPSGSGTNPREMQAADPADIELLRGTARKIFADDLSLEVLGDAGLLALLTPESLGGAGWHPVEACVVAEEAGRTLSGVPWASNLLAAAALSGDLRWRDTAESLMAGQATASVANRDQLDVDDRTGGVSGKVAVSGSREPDFLVFIGSGREPVVVDCRAERVTFDPSQSFDTTRVGSTAVLREAVAHAVGGADGSLLEDAAVLMACADSLGALSFAASLVQEHLVDRVAFERPLASFQVIQHRLANLSILEAAGDALIGRAAGLLTVAAESRGQLLSATHSYFRRHVPAAIDDCIQLAGGIGFTWEFPLHHAMRRSLANSYAMRSPRTPVTQVFVAPQFDDTRAEADQFRAHARRVIGEHAPFQMREGHRAPTTPEEESSLRTWYRVLYENGLIGASWPADRGGDPDHNPLHELVVKEELIRARAPRPIDQVQLASHVIISFGDDAQKTRYLPRIRKAEDIWCQLFSEPDCGSDLAGIKARAELRSDGRWALSGQKTWTTDGHWAQMGLALLRTSTEGRRHEGLTAFLVPMDSAGLELRPKLTIGGAYEFNDVFLDGIVLEPEQVIGGVGNGWVVAMSGLEVERFGVGGDVLLLELLIADLVRLAGSIDVDRSPILDRLDVRQEIATLESEASAARAFVADHVDRALRNIERPADASIAKALYSETYHAIARYGAELVAEHSPVPDTAASEAQRLVDAWLWSRALTISGGTSEIMRNIIAKRRLRLPQ